MVIGLPLMWIASRLPVKAWRLFALPRSGRVRRAAGARRRRRHRGQRQPELARLRRAVPHPAVRAGQARAGAVGRRPAGPQGAAARPVEAPARAARAGRRLRHRRSSCSAATSAPRSSSSRSSPRCCGWPARRCGCSSAGGLRRPRWSSRAWSDTRSDPAVAHHDVAAPRPGRPARQRVPGAARQVRARVRRLVGRRPRRLQGEVGQPARGAHRLHLRDHRRGARPGRHARRARAVRRSSATPGCAIAVAADRPVRPAAPPPASPPGSLVQALVNIGAVLGLLPITGVPLPLVSYGGSALRPDDARPRACCCPSRGR